MTDPRTALTPARSTRRLALIGAVCALVCVAGLLALTLVSRFGGGGAAEAGALPWSGALQQDPGEADGVVDPEHPLSVFDTEHPAVTGLSPDLLAALQAAASDAAAEGIEFAVNSGWRSPLLQEHLLEQAVSDMGSREEAGRWVATPETSSHVTGDAVDVGPFDASYWLSLNGAAYGLCQTYGNESWHFELRPEAAQVGCPQPYLDPTEDPRLQP